MAVKTNMTEMNELKLLSVRSGGIYGLFVPFT